MLPEKTLVYEFGEFRLDVAKRQLLREDEVVPLYSKAFELLLLLVQSGGRDLTKEEILETIWPGQILEESNLTVNISTVRRALGEKASQPRYLVTIPGRGYRFVGNVSERQDNIGGFIVQTETISQITVEEEKEEDGQEITDVSGRAGSLADHDGKSFPLISPQAPAKQLLSKPAFFSRRAVVLAILSSVIVVVAGILIVRRMQQSRPAANRFKQFKLRQLTNEGRVINAAISPDGKFYVFAQSDKDMVSLRLGSIDGEAPIELRPPASVAYRGIAFASDGGSIFYAASESGQNRTALYRLPLLGRVPVKLRDDFVSYFAISPDSKFVAIVKGNEAARTSSLLVSNLDGSNERALVTLPANRGLFERNLSWSPDGSMIALGLSKDESGGQGAIYLVSLKAGELKQLTTVNWRDIQRTAWLEDNSGILVIGASLDAQENRQVWLVDYPSGEFRRITSDLNSYDIGLSVTSDSNNALMVQHQQISNIWVAPADDLSRAKQITFGAFNRGDGALGIDWAANGKIIYTSMVANSSTIWIMDADGGNAKELTPPGAQDTTPSVTSDGQHIIFESSRSGASEIWRMNLDGADPKQLTSCGKNVQPSVSPDARWVVYRSECDSTSALWRVSIEGGEPTRLTDQAASWPWVSPDSKWVACEYWTGKDQLAIIPIGGGTAAKLFEIPPLANFRYGIRWTADGKAITYRDWGQGIWRQSIEGGPAERLHGLPEEKVYSNGWSRDGKLFAFTRGVEIRDVVLISNVNQ